MSTYLNLCAQVDAQYRELIEFDSSFYVFFSLDFNYQNSSVLFSILSKIKTYLAHHINTYENISVTNQHTVLRTFNIFCRSSQMFILEVSLQLISRSYFTNKWISIKVNRFKNWDVNVMNSIFWARLFRSLRINLRAVRCNISNMAN